MRSIYGVLLGGLLALSNMACAPLSEEEKKERREDAFDLAGSYSTKAEGQSEVAMQMTITNVSGRHLINVDVTRSNELTKKELDALTTRGLDPARIQSAFVNQSIAFSSAGKFAAEWDGGDNISSNNGKSSNFRLCSDKMVTGLKTKDGESVTIYYCVVGAATKEAIIRIAGELQLVISTNKNRPIEDGKVETYTTVDSVALNFATTNGKALHSQYGGFWTGRIYAEQSIYVSNIVGIELVIGNGTFHAYPLFREMSVDGVSSVRKDSVQLDNKTYVFERLDESTRELDTDLYPVVRLVYREKDGASRLVFVGTIWSLGDFSGNILVIDGKSERKVGSFKLSRKQ